MADDKQTAEAACPTLFFVLLVAAPLGVINSFFSTLWRFGFTASFLGEWGRAFLFAYLLTIPGGLIFVPLVRRVLARFSCSS